LRLSFASFVKTALPQAATRLVLAVAHVLLALG
jgi:hypothetical protein